MVEALIVVIAAIAAGFVWYYRTTRRQVDDLQAQSRQKLTDVRSDHQKRVDRLQRKFSSYRERGHLDFAADLLPALDALGHALEQSDGDADVSSLREGLEMVDRELVATLSRHGIHKCCPAPGDAFDPNVHEAVAVAEADEIDPGRVVECFRPGYRHEERVLRAAAVSVAGDQAEASSPEEVSPDSVDGDSPGPDSSSRL